MKSQGMHTYWVRLQSNGKVTSSGHPSLSLPSAIEMPSGQHPNKVSLHCEGGQPSLFSPSAGDKPSLQQPNLVSLQVVGWGQPVEKIHL